MWKTSLNLANDEDVRGVRSLGLITAFNIKSGIDDAESWVIILAILDAGSMCPRPMCPRPKVL